MSNDLVVQGSKVFLDGKLEAATIHIKDGIICKIEKGISKVTGALNAGDSVIMSGVVDTHAHINEPGRTEWEGFETATRAAAAGGITTVVDMPLNSIPATTTLEALQIKAAAAEGHCRIDYGFWGGVIPGNAGELLKMIDAGALGFKAFMIESGVDEFPMSTERDLKEAMTVLSKSGRPLLVHAEVDTGKGGGFADSKK